MASRRSLVAGSVASVVAVGLGSIPAHCAGKIYPGARLQDLALGGMNRDVAAQAIHQALADFEATPVTLTYDDRSWTPTLAELGVTVEYDRMLDDAMNLGRDGGVVQRYASFFSHYDDRPVSIAYTVDDERLATYINEVAEEIDVLATNARLVLEEGEIRLIDDELGVEMEQDIARQDILRVIRSGEAAEIALQTTDVPAELTVANLDTAKQQAWTMVSEPVVFTHDDVAYPVSADDLAAALVIDEDGAASLDIDVLTPRLEAIAATVASSPRNAMFGWDGGLYVVSEDVDGATADLDAMGEMLQRASRDSTRVEQMPMTRVPAAARADNVHELGLERHLGMGSSSFAGSSFERAENVRVAARNISYKLVAPGETFSFNELLGPITEEYGYIAGTIIQGDWVASDIGGGVCQVSTTVFRAAVNAGFRFSEWNPHSWRLGFYELDGSPPGLDAAIYQPNTEWE